MAHETRWPAPAKLNLFLHVTGRRADGYHLIESLFALVDLADTVTLASDSSGRISRTRLIPGVDESADLAVRAARALQASTGCRQGVAIGVEKRIPQGGGLGGGSSDAATVLLGLNRLWSLALPREELASIGLALGADVPFFVHGENAFVSGVGERIAPVSLPVQWLALAMPGVGVSTAEVFAAPALTRSTPSAKINVFSEGYGRNDLAAVVQAKVPDVARAMTALRRASPHARMTGSGSCVIAPFGDERSALAAVAALPDGIAGTVVRTLARHPLKAFA